MASNGKRLRDAVAESLMVEPALAQAEFDLHSSQVNGEGKKLRARMQELLSEAPSGPVLDSLVVPGLEPGLVSALRRALEESVASNATLAEAEMEALTSLGLEKLGEFRSAIHSHLAGEPELADRDLAIYVKAGEGRKSAFQRALEENLRDLGERPPFERTRAEGTKGNSSPLKSTAMHEPNPAGQEETPAPAEQSGTITSSKDLEEHPVRSVRLSSGTPESSERRESEGVDSAAAIARAPRMEPLPLLTAALEAVGFAEDEFGFVLRYGSYAQPGRSSEFLVGGMGLSDLSDRLAGWLEAQGATDCEVQVLDDGSGELMIYLLGRERPIASPRLAGEGE
jgi:hypothetical protein